MHRPLRNPQNLSSTRVLSSTHPIRRLYNVVHTNPNIADGSNWRRFKGDLTLIVRGYKTVGTNVVTLFECYGLFLAFDRPSQTPPGWPRHRTAAMPTPHLTSFGRPSPPTTISARDSIQRWSG